MEKGQSRLGKKGSQGEEGAGASGGREGECRPPQDGLETMPRKKARSQGPRPRPQTRQAAELGGNGKETGQGSTLYPTSHLSYLKSSPNLLFKWLQEVYRS